MTWLFFLPDTKRLDSLCLEDYSSLASLLAGITSVTDHSRLNIFLRCIVTMPTVAMTKNKVSCGAASGKAGLINCQ